MTAPQPTLMLTRPPDAAERFLRYLDPAALDGVHVCLSPLIAVRPCVTSLDLGGFKGVIFTSRNGVRIASDLTPQRDVPAFCVGATTTEFARACGWSAQSMGQSAADLVAALPGHAPDTPLLHLRGVHTRGDIAATLSGAGLQTHDLVLYDQPQQPFTAQADRILSGSGAVVAPIFSPRTAQIFVDLLPDRPVICAALSPAVAEPLRRSPAVQVHIAAAPDAESMARLVEKLLHSCLPG